MGLKADLRQHSLDCSAPQKRTSGHCRDLAIGSERGIALAFGRMHSSIHVYVSLVTLNVGGPLSSAGSLVERRSGTTPSPRDEAAPPHFFIQFAVALSIGAFAFAVAGPSDQVRSDRKGARPSARRHVVRGPRRVDVRGQADRMARCSQHGLRHRFGACVSLCAHPLDAFSSRGGAIVLSRWYFRGGIRDQRRYRNGSP